MDAPRESLRWTHQSTGVLARAQRGEASAVFLVDLRFAEIQMVDRGRERCDTERINVAVRGRISRGVQIEPRKRLLLVGSVATYCR